DHEDWRNAGFRGIEVAIPAVGRVVGSDPLLTPLPHVCLPAGRNADVSPPRGDPAASPGPPISVGTNVTERAISCGGRTCVTHLPARHAGCGRLLLHGRVHFTSDQLLPLLFVGDGHAFTWSQARKHRPIGDV